ncbi:MAG TPA: hypothetical protein VHI99_05530 [Vicinamibacterales bacterium]|jgi:hypothetical protein|nr:hypothetical protein [Vicinamibacterales bacterium]
MQKPIVYAECEKFKLGWVAGFYDARADDGLRYLDDVLRYGVCDVEQESFLAGYRAGVCARRGESSSILELPAGTFKTAA